MSETSSVEEAEQVIAGLESKRAALARDGSTRLTEGEVTALATAHAMSKHPGLNPDRAFAKLFTDQSADGQALREAVNIAKGMTRKGSPVGDEYDEPDEDEDSDGDTDGAYGKLRAKAIELRKIRPDLTEAKAFAVVFTDPANARLAKRALA